MDEFSDLESIIANIITDQSSVSIILGKTMEILRRMSIKFPIGSMNKAETSRKIVAIEISCRIHNISFKKNSLMRYSQVDERDLQAAIQATKNALDITWTELAMMETLAIRFGGTYKDSAYKVLQKYKTAYIDKLSEAVRRNIDLQQPVYHAVAFWIVAKAKKMKIKQSTIIEASNVDASTFRSVLARMESVYKGDSATSNLTIGEPRKLLPSDDRKINDNGARGGIKLTRIGDILGKVVSSSSSSSCGSSSRASASSRFSNGILTASSTNTSHTNIPSTRHQAKLDTSHSGTTGEFTLRKRFSDTVSSKSDLLSVSSAEKENVCVNTERDYSLPVIHNDDPKLRQLNALSDKSDKQKTNGNRVSEVEISSAEKKLIERKAWTELRSQFLANRSAVVTAFADSTAPLKKQKLT